MIDCFNKVTEVWPFIRFKLPTSFHHFIPEIKDNLLRAGVYEKFMHAYTYSTYTYIAMLLWIN